MDIGGATVRAEFAGAIPEQVLVLEIVGSVGGFLNAVRRIPGLEWLGELDQSLEPDDDFYMDSEDVDPGKALQGELFLVFTNQEAMHQLESMWRRFTKDDDFEFPYGLARWRQVFNRLKTIRSWDERDRLERSGVVDDWQERIVAGQDEVPAEIELWFREDNSKREEAEAAVAELVAAEGGTVVARSVVAEIAYHALLAVLPRALVERIIEEPDVALVRYQGVMLFRPVGQAVAPAGPDDVADAPLASGSLPGNSITPLVALLDGLPLENHDLLAGRLVVDDPDDWASDYTAAERRHGTAMSSLVVWGELDGRESPIATPLYVRPIMKPDHRDWRSPRGELIPEDVLPVDLLLRSVRRLYEGDGDEPAVAPGVRIINLSICDPAMPFARAVSPLARLIDWLSWTYPAVFVVSAGNHGVPVSLPATPAALEAMTARERESHVLRSLATELHRRRILSPAESINSIAVGSAHDDLSATAGAVVGTQLIDSRSLPAPYSAIGGGFRRSVKPDILCPGGRGLYREAMVQGASSAFGLIESGRAPGQVVACPGPGGSASSTRHERGTSNATAIASRRAEYLYRVVVGDVLARANGQLDERAEAVLLKALLVHTASWGHARSRLFDALQGLGDGSALKDYTARFLGYGSIDTDKVATSTDQRVTLVGFGTLNDGKADEFEVPLPPSLSGADVWRRLTLTLAWVSPTNSANRLYRRAQLWIDPPRQELALNRQEAQWQAVQRGTVQHEILEGDEARPFADGDSLRLIVNCKADAGPLTDEIRYSLIATLEVAPELDLPIYEEIATRLRVPVAVATRGG